MKEHAIEIARSASGGISKLNLMREYIQAEVLYTLQQIGAFQHIAFVGGTALRFLYHLPRYSIDLDFSLENRQNYHFNKLEKKLETRLALSGYRFSLALKIDRVVQIITLKFGDIMWEGGISPHRNQKLALKIEIDSRPPKGAETDTTIVRKHFFLNLWHYRLSSLFAGKIHALLTRKWTKGRDIFDLIWYLTLPEKIEPNFTLLNNALAQTGWQSDPVSQKNWKHLLANLLEKQSFKNVVEDAQDFFEDPNDVILLERDKILSLLA